MDAERWQKLERLFHQALECEPSERSRMLGEACSGDEELRREVESLLVEHERGGSLLDTPASDLAADWAQSHHQIKAEEMLGHFRILAPLGRGGMGEVYLAEDARLGRKVALKMLPPLFSGQEQRMRRFEREARAVSALNHPNIITLYEIGEAGAIRFMATEYIEGETLRALLGRGSLPAERVLEVGVQVASALAAAHEAGILHRDIKPENIMLRPDGLVKVLDFGLAKLIGRQTALLETADLTAVPVESAPGMAISSTKAEYHCAFSPDGRRVAFTSTRSGDAELWVSDADGSGAVQLTSLQAQDTNCPAWSPDGEFIAFSSNSEGEWDIYLVPAAGGKPRRLTSHQSIDIGPSFSRDGRWIYFTSMRSGDYRIWRMPATGGDAQQVTPNQGARAFESIDGRNLFYPMFSTVSPLWRLPTRGGEPVKVLDGIVWFNFWLLEDGAYYIDRLGEENRLQYLNFITGRSTTVARNIGEVTAGLTASPDGRTILYARVDAYTDDLMLVENFR